MTKKEAFDKAQERYRQARANTYAAYQAHVAAKALYNQAVNDEADAMREYHAFVGATKESLKYMMHLDEIGLS